VAVWRMRTEPVDYETTIDEICSLDWENLSKDALVNIAWVYYYFSIQFRENLEIACQLYPWDRKLRQLMQEECNTDNLSPWPDVASTGERMNHDEFMRRLLTLSPIDQSRGKRLETIGQRYLNKVYEFDSMVRASSIVSYEDGGLERVFGAILTSRDWTSPLLQAFRHFLSQHIEFDNNPTTGHGALSRHLRPGDQIIPLWTAFKHMLIEAAPTLLSRTAGTTEENWVQSII